MSGGESREVYPDSGSFSEGKLNSPQSHGRKRLKALSIPDGNKTLRHRKSTSKFEFMNDSNNSSGELDCKEVFRKILRELYESGEKEKIDVFEEDAKPIVNRTKDQDVNKFVRFLNFVSAEHGNMLSFVIFLPLILTTFYIAFIENSPLFIKLE